MHSNKKTKRNLNNATKNSSEYTTSNNQSVNEELRYVMGESIYLYRRVTKEQGYLSNDQYVLSNTKKKKRMSTLTPISTAYLYSCFSLLH